MPANGWCLSLADVVPSLIKGAAMKRSEVLPVGVSRAPLARIASLGLAIASLTGTACAPDQGVKPGAPELFAYYIVQAGPTPTKILPSTPDCPTPAAGAMCRPMPPTAGGAGHALPRCRREPLVQLHRRRGRPDDGRVELRSVRWRHLRHRHLRSPARHRAAGSGRPANSPTDIATATAGATSTAVPVLTDYGSNGTPTGLVIPIFAQFFAR